MPGDLAVHLIAVERVAGLIGAEPSRADPSAERRSDAATAIHYGIGVGSGAPYGAIRRRIPAPAPARGLAFGAALWLVADEVANPALGLTPGPTAFPCPGRRTPAGSPATWSSGW
jgi:hypothetical protein